MARSGHRPLTRPFVARLGPDRTVAVVVAGIVLGASVVSLSGSGRVVATGGPIGDAPAARIAVGGGAGIVRGGGATDAGAGIGTVEFGEAPTRISPLARGVAIDIADGAVDEAGPSGPATVAGPFLDDGTLLKPMAVDTTVADGSALVKSYKVKSGDTLREIAVRARVTTMTLLWANNLGSASDIYIGQVLRIPPVSGLIVTVGSADTLDLVAKRYEVDRQDILAANQLEDPNLVVGQVLVVPGAKGRALPVPGSTTKSAPRTRSTIGGGGGVAGVRGPVTYTGGAFVWPVVGGANYISQYYHYGHYGLDIAGDYGSRVRAAGSGTVIFAGWKSNGGGYQVWVAHGSNLFSTYNHMSGVSVARGQEISKGQQVGRVGQSGNATGPHLHFEVWRGAVWDGGSRVNPLGYL